MSFIMNCHLIDWEVLNHIYFYWADTPYDRFARVVDTNVSQMRDLVISIASLQGHVTPYSRMDDLDCSDRYLKGYKVQFTPTFDFFIVGKLHKLGLVCSYKAGGSIDKIVLYFKDDPSIVFDVIIDDQDQKIGFVEEIERLIKGADIR